MFIEEYRKTKGGKPYYNVYYRFGRVVVSITDITATSEDEVKTKAKVYLKKALEGEK